MVKVKGAVRGSFSKHVDHKRQCASLWSQIYRTLFPNITQLFAEVVTLAIEIWSPHIGPRSLYSQPLSWPPTRNLPMTIHRAPNERDPLLQAENGRTDDRVTNPGPMEIPRSTRYGILAGIWLATFLTVSPYTNEPSWSYNLMSLPSIRLLTVRFI